MLAAPSASWRTTTPRTRGYDGVLVCPPDHFEVVDAKNAFMVGQQGRVDARRARAQWDALGEAYRALGRRVEVVDARPGCEDMVFTANVACVLPADTDGPQAVRSRMRHPSREREVEPVARWLDARGLRPRPLPAGAGVLEGHGDVLVVPGRALVLAGHGGRTERTAVAALAAQVRWPVVPIGLLGTVFYHLDTALALLDEETILWHPPAFTRAGRAALETLFPRRIASDPEEAEHALACNAHGLGDGRVLVPAQAARTAQALADAGLLPHAVDVSEFHRSGGSVFCLKLELPG